VARSPARLPSVPDVRDHTVAGAIAQRVLEQRLLPAAVSIGHGRRRPPQRRSAETAADAAHRGIATAAVGTAGRDPVPAQALAFARIGAAHEARLVVLPPGPRVDLTAVSLELPFLGPPRQGKTLINRSPLYNLPAALEECAWLGRRQHPRESTKHQAPSTKPPQLEGAHTRLTGQSMRT
jgi:hypothetical protein